MSQTAITLCAGGGGASLGMQQAGVQLVGAVEYDPAIAAHYAAVFGMGSVVCAKVEDVDYRQWADIDGIQASPSCKQFSQANAGGKENAADLAVAEAIARAIKTIRPRWFWLEQVRAYANSQSCGIIRAALYDLDYWSHSTVCNATAFGVPQDRDRYILRAVQGGLWQPFRPLPAARPWVGWYAATADLWPDCADDAFAPWQLARLPDALRRRGYLVAGSLRTKDGDQWLHEREADMPTFTLTGSMIDRGIRAFLVDGRDGDFVPRAVGDPAATVQAYQTLAQAPCAFLVGAQYSQVYGAQEPQIALSADPSFVITGSNVQRGVRAWLDQGVVKRASLRCLARWQSVPDTYPLPIATKLASTIIGNMVAPPMAEGVTRSLL